MTKQTWIADVHGVHALVDDEQLELWTRVRGWHLADEPGPTTQVHVVNGDHAGRLPFEALAEGWADQGWAPGPPPEPVYLTRDPEPEVPAAPVMPKPKAAAGGEKIEE